MRKKKACRIGMRLDPSVLLQPTHQTAGQATNKEVVVIHQRSVLRNDDEGHRYTNHQPVVDPIDPVEAIEGSHVIDMDTEDETSRHKASFLFS